jgi:general secretion pathway protein J
MDKRLKKNNGFTLIEILLAIFILGLLLTTVYGSFNRVLSDVEAIDTDLIMHEAVNTCFVRMAQDLKSVYISMPPRYSTPEFDSIPDPFRLIGQPGETEDRLFEKLRFASSAHLPIDKTFPWGIAEIVYYVEADGQDEYVLRRSDRTDFEYQDKANAYNPVLCKNVRSLKFTYYDKEGKEYEFWDSEDTEYGCATPSAIDIELGVGKTDPPFVFKTSIKMPVYREKIEEGIL